MGPFPWAHHPGMPWQSMKGDVTKIRGESRILQGKKEKPRRHRAHLDEAAKSKRW
jgi:hypothetical protein